MQDETKCVPVSGPPVRVSPSSSASPADDRQRSLTELVQRAVRVVDGGQGVHPAVDILTDDQIRRMRLGIFDAERLVAGVLDRWLQRKACEARRPTARCMASAAPAMRERAQDRIEDCVEAPTHVDSEEPEHEVAVLLQELILPPIAAIGLFRAQML